jgi:YHS domain-containing protein
MERILSFVVYAGLFYLMMSFGCGAHMGHGKHSGHEHGSPKPSNSDTLRDPVCGMPVGPGEGYSKFYEGRELRFCSRACLDKFEAQEHRYAA